MKKHIQSLYHFLSPKFQTIHLDYPVHAVPRYGHGKTAHSLLEKIISANNDIYQNHLEGFLSYTEQVLSIRKTEDETNTKQPVWNNGFFPGLDIVGLYGMIARYKPKLYIEIGSGNSTKVARKSITEQNTGTKITSIDPFPRADIDALSDEVMRIPFENIKDNTFITESLHENDILFIDNSHRAFPNSDVTICFLELLPNLRKGVIVHIHDIYLPYDYPQFMCDRYYNEQYLLAAFLLANPDKFKTILPNYYISEDRKLSEILKPLWNHSELQGVEKHGGSFWLRIE